MEKGKISFRPVHNTAATGTGGIGRIEVLRNMKVVAVIHSTEEGVKIESECPIVVSARGGKSCMAFNYDPRNLPIDIDIEIGHKVKRTR